MNKNWSILIWTMILSLFIILLFISIDSIYKKSSFFTSFFEQRNKSNSNLSDILNSLKSNPINSFISEENIIESMDYDWLSSFSWFLANKEGTELWISNSWGTSVLTWSVIEGWSLLYKLVAFDIAAPSSAIVSSSWILTYTWIKLYFTWSYNYNILYLEWSGWLALYNINKANTTLLPQKNIYKLYKNIWNYKKFIRNFEIENFWIKSFSWINYTLLWLY